MVGWFLVTGPCRLATSGQATGHIGRLLLDAGRGTALMECALTFAPGNCDRPLGVTS